MCALMSICSFNNLSASLSIDLTIPVHPVGPTELGQGTNTNPQEDKITADNRSFFFNDTPWIPVAGEFHYSRYPAEEWRDELLKIKAGGIDIVPTYVFWIHHEEHQGQFNWSGRHSLRDFVKLCGQLDLKVIVRMGPWCHGEARNGGLPDWVQNSGTKLRTTDPAFMALVEPFYREIAKQIEGLLWKDGGPVIGVQHDNERNDVPYLLALKELARSEGVDVPLYTMTGWNRVNIPPSELLPLFGAYSIAFWYPHSNMNFRKSFFFTDIRDDGDMGAQFVNKHPHRSENILRYPYVCCEIGGGMPSSYTKRIKVEPDEIASMALVRLGCGSNMPGYYMYHGGINPDGDTWLNEEHPNPMPIKDYDFQAPIGTFGQIRDQYHLLRMQHLFIKDFGSKLARMPLYLPDDRPSGLDDIDTIRWSIRSDGHSGFVFFNNYQPVIPLSDKRDVQFEVKTKDDMLKFPLTPIKIPKGCYGILPFRMDCDNVMLEYATAQPICRVMSDEGTPVYFFTALEEITPELAFRKSENKIKSDGGNTKEISDLICISDIECGTKTVVSVKRPDKGKVDFIVLTPVQARQLWRLTFAERDRVLLSEANLLRDNKDIRLQSHDSDAMQLAMFPAVENITAGSKMIKGSQDGIFRQYALKLPSELSGIEVAAIKEQDAGPKALELKGTEEAVWQEAAVWKLDIPADVSHDHLILNINYFGDAARIYVGDELFNDNYFNGDPFALGLWRIRREKWPDIRLKVLPYSNALMSRLPESAKQIIIKAKEDNTLNDIRVEVVPQYELRISP